MIVATNKHWHALPTIHACQAGKDVYIEKPLAHSIGEGRAMVQAAEKYNRIVQIGTQQHSCQHYQQAVEIIRSGELGEISEVKVWDYENQYPGWGSPPDCDPPAGLDWDFWLGPAPKVPYNPNYFLHDYWFFDYAGSFQCDWAVHHYDIVHWAMGVDRPKAVVALGGMMCFPENNLQYPDTLDAILEYPPGPVSKQGFIMQYTFRGGCRREHRSHGKCFFGTKASLFLDRGGYTITPENAIEDKSKQVTVDGTTDNHVAGLPGLPAQPQEARRGCRGRPLRHHSRPPHQHRLEVWPQDPLGCRERRGQGRSSGQRSGPQEVPGTLETGGVVESVPISTGGVAASRQQAMAERKRARSMGLVR